MVRSFDKNLNQTIIDLAKLLNKTFTANDKNFGPTKVGVVGPLPPALPLGLVKFHKSFSFRFIWATNETSDENCPCFRLSFSFVIKIHHACGSNQAVLLENENNEQ